VSNSIVDRVHDDGVDHRDVVLGHRGEVLVERNIDQSSPIRDEFFQVTS